MVVHRYQMLQVIQCKFFVVGKEPDPAIEQYA